MEHQSLPPLFCPFPSQIAPAAAALGDISLAWAQRCHLLADSAIATRFVGERYWLLIARAFPAADFASLALVADWNSWGFLLDDLGDASAAGRNPARMRQTFAAILAVMHEDAPVVRPEPLFASLNDIWQRLRQRSTPAWRAELRQTLAHSFTSYLWEAANRALGIIPARSDYLRMRLFTGAWLTYLRLYELIAEISLPPDIRRHPLLRDYLTAVNRTIVCANDLVSFAKEQTHGDMHNLVMIVQRETGCTEPAAIRRVADYHNEEMQRCLALEARLATLAPVYASDIQKYIAFARAFMRGNLDWSVESGRYGAITLPIVDVPPLSTAEPVRRAGGVILPSRSLWLVGAGIAIAGVSLFCIGRWRWGGRSHEVQAADAPA